MLPQSATAKKRAKHTFAGDYRSSDSSATPMDLNHPVYKDESSGTLMSFRRPAGIKASKGKGKGKAKATSSQAALPAPTPTPTLGATTAPTSAAGHAYTKLVASADFRTLLDTHNALRKTDDPTQVAYLQDMIEHLYRKLGML